MDRDRQADEIDRQLRELHGGAEVLRLSDLHLRAAEIMDSRKGRRFHLTQAWVFALVAGDARRVSLLERELRSLGAL
ncbi:MAG: hypothetical protein ACE5FS_07740 [Paracoccaceae bacterium]